MAAVAWARERMPSFDRAGFSATRMARTGFRAANALFNDLLPRTLDQHSCTGGRAPPPPRTIADASLSIHRPSLGMAAGALALAAGPHPRRVLSMMARSGFTGFHSALPPALVHWRRGPTPAPYYR